MTTLDLVSLVVGALLPPLIAVVNQPRWPGWLKLLVTGVVCVVGGLVTAAATGQLTGKRGLESVMVVAAAAVGFYKAAWHPSDVAPAIERATSPAPPAG